MKKQKAIIVFDKICVEFGIDHNVIHALDKISFSVQKGEFVTLLGPSGCGKSTILRVAAGLQSWQAGSVDIKGIDPDEARAKRLFGVVFQKPVLFPWRTVLDNILLPFQVGPKNQKLFTSSGELTQTATDILELVGLLGFEDSLPSELSGGMQARVAVARALIMKPEILLMDEPFASIDQLSRTRLNNELLRIQKVTGCTILFITHSIEEAVYLSDRVVILSSRPARVVKEVAINLPHRDNSIISSGDYIAYIEKIRKILLDHQSITEATA